MEAVRKCPELMLVPPNYGLYQKSSAAFMEILRQYAPLVEQYSIDEAYCDMTGTECLYGQPLIMAEEIRRKIYRELGFTVNIGVANNKVLAKMASDFRKPDMVHSLWDEEIQTKMWPLPVNELFFVGRSSARKLRDLGIKTIGDLARTDLGIVKAHMGKHGETIWAFANGYDYSAVEPLPWKYMRQHVKHLMKDGTELQYGIWVSIQAT